MSSRKISQLPAAAAVTDDDLVAIVDDPLGVPETKKATISQVAANIVSSSVVSPRLLPPGGSNTFLLAKQSGSDYDVTWVPQSNAILPVTTAQRNALAAYVGLVVYNTDVDRLQVWDGSIWRDTGETFFAALTTAQRNALTPYSGQTILNIDNGQVQTWNGTDWIVSTGVPAVTTAERNALTPYIGQVVYNIDEFRLQLYNSAIWENFGQSYFEPLTTIERNALTPFPGQTIFNLTTGLVETWDGANWIVSTGIPAYTTTERNALTVYVGQVIFNTDVNRLQIWDGSIWRDSGETYFDALTTAQRNALIPFVGQTILNTDTSEIQVWDGSVWQIIAASPPASMATLTDVDLTTLADEDLLTYDSSSGDWLPITRANLAGDTAFSSLYASPDDVLALVIALGG